MFVLFFVQTPLLTDSRFSINSSTSRLAGENVTLPSPFALAIYKLILGEPIGLDDLQVLDTEVRPSLFFFALCFILVVEISPALYPFFF